MCVIRTAVCAHMELIDVVDDDDNRERRLSSALGKSSAYDEHARAYDRVRARAAERILPKTGSKRVSTDLDGCSQCVPNAHSLPPLLIMSKSKHPVSIITLDTKRLSAPSVARNLDRQHQFEFDFRIHRKIEFRSARFGFYIGAPIVGKGLSTVVEQYS